MRRLSILTLAVLAIPAVALAGPKQKNKAPAEAPKPTVTAVATLESRSESTVTGTVTLSQEGGAGPVKVNIVLKGATPGEHAVHVHEKGDCSAADGSSAGSHFNPEQHQHGDVMSAMKHPGDFGNVMVGPDGAGVKEFSVDSITLAPGQLTTVTGLAVIVHAKVDDFSQPVGNAGGRQACGVLTLQGGAQ